jgi:fatty-acyl-CoA synthase
MQNHQLTVGHFLDRARTLFGDKEMITATSAGLRRRTYLDLYRRSGQLRAMLDDLDVSAGGRVGSIAWNTDNHVDLYLGVPCAGRVLHTINSRLSDDEIVYIVDHAEDEVLFCDRSVLDVVAPLLDRFDSVRQLIVMDDGRGGPEIPSDALDYELTLSQFESIPLESGSEDQAAYVCYTSGTTGKPKGVVYSHRSTYLHTLVMMARDTLAIGERDACLPVVPMFHALSWGIIHASVAAGATLVLPGRDLSARALIDLIEECSVTLAAGVPTVWSALADQFEPGSLGSLRLILSGGSAVPPTLSERFREAVGLPILQAWGMTELNPVGTICTIKSKLASGSEAEQAALRAAAGIPVPGVEIRTVEPESGEVLPWNGEAVGELQARGPWVAAAYFRDPSPESFTSDGWFRTGDLAVIDPEGYMRIVDRTKDLIKSGGEWISSVTLENEIMAHPDVAEAAVIGVPHERWQERPVACVVVRPGAKLTHDKLCDFLEGRVAKWWFPDDLLLVEEIPRTSTGKFSKRTLRARVLAGMESKREA